MIYSELKDDVDLRDVTVEEAEDNQSFVDELNYLVDEGFVEMEVGPDGEPRFYPVK